MSRGLACAACALLGFAVPGVHSLSDAPGARDRAVRARRGTDI